MKETYDGYCIEVRRKDGTLTFLAYGSESPRFFTNSFLKAHERRRQLAPHLPNSTCKVVKATLTIEVLPRAKKKSKVPVS